LKHNGFFEDAPHDGTLQTEVFALKSPLPYKTARELSNVEEFRRRVIYEDNHLLVVDKPVCLTTQGAPADEDSLFTLAQHYVKVRYNKPGAVYLGVVSRLDFPVSGVVVFARTSKSARRLNEQIRERSVRKFYQALVEGVVKPSSGELVDYICENPRTRRLWIATNLERDKRFAPKKSLLNYRTIENYPTTTLVEVELITGRKHQIRLQFSHRGTPIMCDGKYGARIQKHAGICLHACQMILEHPTQKRRMAFVSPHPDWTALK
jgi:23S rRNA pseudouridine1911/1915/1917 synthase